MRGSGHAVQGDICRLPPLCRTLRPPQKMQLSAAALPTILTDRFPCTVTPLSPAAGHQQARLQCSATLSVPCLVAMGALPSEALEVLQRLSASNEGRLPDKLALLERRLTVPPSPAVSGQGGSALLARENSIHSVTQAPSGLQREGTPSISNSQLLQAGRSLDGLEAPCEQPSKRRRVGVAGAKQEQAGGGSRGASPPDGAPLQQRPSMSPFLGENGAAAIKKQQQQPTPGSSKKQKNTISRYFPTMSGGNGAVAGGGGTAAAATAPARPSPTPSDSQAPPPTVSAIVQTLQLEAQRLR